MIPPGMSGPRKSPESIFIFQTDGDEPVLGSTAESDENSIDGTWRTPLGGFGRRVFEKIIKEQGLSHSSLILELAKLTAAAALAVREHVYHSLKEGDKYRIKVEELWPAAEEDLGRASELRPVGFFPVKTDPDRIRRSISILFNVPEKSLHELKHFQALLQGQDLLNMPTPPGLLTALLDGFDSKDASIIWTQLRGTMIPIVGLTLSFAHVYNMEEGQRLPIVDRDDILSESNFVRQLRSWGGNDRIVSYPKASFEVIARLLLGPRSELSERASLASKKGWSVFINTVGIADPSAKGNVSIRPCPALYLANSSTLR